MPNPTDQDQNEDRFVASPGEFVFLAAPEGDGEDEAPRQADEERP